jgi:arylsulfatase A
MPTRRQFLAGSAVAMGGAAMVTAMTEATGQVSKTGEAGEAAGVQRHPPNIILILHDDLGHGETGPYGQRVVKTPNIDRLAAEGLRFTSYYGGGCVCAPSRSVALTGLHGGHTTVRQNPERGVSMALQDSDVTFAEVLRTRGYRTGHFGKWGFGPTVGGQPSHPNNRGFEEFFGYLTHHEAHNYFPPFLWHNDARFPLDGRTYAPPMFVERAVEFITANKDRPFMIYLAPNLPHAPSAVPPPLVKGGPYDNPAWSEPNRGHAAQVALLDQHVGQVVDTVTKLGLAERTFIMVTSDHGPHEEGGVNPDLFGSRGGLRGYKRNLYEGGIRVPFIAWKPGTVPAGTSDAPVGHVDLLPTLAELGDSVRPTDLDGRSFAGLLTGTAKQPPERDHFYWYRRDPYSTGRADRAEGGKVTRMAEAVRRDNWKLIRIAHGHERPATPGGYAAVELFDLAADPRETTNVAAAHPDVVAQLTARMNADWAAVYYRVPYGLSVQVGHAPGSQTATATVTFANGTAVPLTLGAVSLQTYPPQIQVNALSTPRHGSVPVGSSVTGTWQLTLPEDYTTASASWILTATATAATGPTMLNFSREHRVNPPHPRAPSFTEPGDPPD